MKMRETLVHTQVKFAKNVERWKKTLDSFPLLFESLEQIGLEPYFDSKDGCINLSFDGDSERLQRVWKELRIAGFKPGRQAPVEPASTFSTYWTHIEKDEGYAEVWMYFSSSVCHMVQVGTKMVEQPVYEVQCGSALGELLSSENDNAQVREG